MKGLGIILIWLGVTVTAAGVLLLVYQAETCELSSPGTCILLPYVLVVVIGIVTTIIGYFISSRHRGKVAS